MARNMLCLGRSWSSVSSWDRRFSEGFACFQYLLLSLRLDWCANFPPVVMFCPGDEGQSRWEVQRWDKKYKAKPSDCPWSFETLLILRFPCFRTQSAFGFVRKTEDFSLLYPEAPQLHHPHDQVHEWDIWMPGLFFPCHPSFRSGQFLGCGE